MNLIFSKQAWADYLHRQQTDKKILKRINRLIQDVQRTPYEGLVNLNLSNISYPDTGPDASTRNSASFTKLQMTIY